MISTIIIAVSTGIKILRRLSTVYGSQPIGFVFLFTVGGLTGFVLNFLFNLHCN